MTSLISIIPIIAAIIGIFLTVISFLNGFRQENKISKSTKDVQRDTQELENLKQINTQLITQFLMQRMKDTEIKSVENSKETFPTDKNLDKNDMVANIM